MRVRGAERLPLAGLLVILALLAGEGRGQPTPTPPLSQRLQIPPGVPGSQVPPLVLPDTRPENAARRKEAIERLFPPLPPLEPLPALAPTPTGVPWTLADLEKLARAHSPAIRQAAAAVEAARGNARQAGLPPNPTVGYQGDTIRQANTAGLQGGFIEQTIKTGGKLQLSRAAGLIDVATAETALRQTEMDVLTQVRNGYFAVLVARESVRINTALAQMVNEVYRIQVDRVRTGQAAPYQPLEARTQAVQARNAVLRARNRFISAWKQLAVALGMPDLPPTELADSAGVTPPVFSFETARERALRLHTEVLTAENGVQRARVALRLAEITPIPDVGLRYLVQKDNTTPPFNIVHSVAVNLELPLWNRNQGGIRAAQSNLARAGEEALRVRNDLTSRLAAAFERYANNLTLLETYRDQILPDQVRVYRGVYERYERDPDAVNFEDVATTQQNLVNNVQGYVAALGDLWSSVVELASLVQADDFFCPFPEK